MENGKLKNGKLKIKISKWKWKNCKNLKKCKIGKNELWKRKGSKKNRK